MALVAVDDRLAEKFSWGPWKRPGCWDRGWACVRARVCVCVGVLCAPTTSLDAPEGEGGVMKASSDTDLTVRPRVECGGEAVLYDIQGFGGLV